MAKKKSSFHMGDEFNGSGKKTYLRATQHNTYAPLPQHNVRLTPNFSKFIPMVIGTLPISIETTLEGSEDVIKATGSIANVKQVILNKEEGTGKYEIYLQIKKIALTTGAYLQNSFSEIKEDFSVIKEKEANFVGYLAYGAESITQDEEEGFFRLYDAPTLDAEGSEQYFCNALYEEYGLEPYGALQGFGGKNSALNPYGNTTYGGQNLDPEIGTLVYNEMERYAIALGPKLQNPDCNLQNYKGTDLAYGTCVDISIELDEVTYYIPAIIVDVKNHTAPTGIFQTGVPLNGTGIVDTGKSGPIVEWYVIKEVDGKNKSAGLKRFNRNASVIIYRQEVLM